MKTLLSITQEDERFLKVESEMKSIDDLFLFCRAFVSFVYRNPKVLNGLMSIIRAYGENPEAAHADITEHCIEMPNFDEILKNSK